ncbi:hypothetical protein [Acidianus manzaensis]|uniref:Uncharacterized protein n=1 Tax=Acidianus manzaensis TaxID=282676 RepID=A0A1W6JZP6_9CREN|nr:hypothetical protein [Acidianus manzaensis]ARM75763.1 hypothetical protein B6F84_06755 [Acidianus manzaensis]
MPVSTFSVLDKLDYCNDKECIENLVDEYLKSLITSSKYEPNFKLFQDEDGIDERVITNSYIFSESLMKKVIFSDIDFDIIIQDLEKKLGNMHPVVMFLKQFKDQ